MENPLVIVGIGALVTLGLAFAARAVLRKYRRIVNLPTSVCRGIAPGLTELKGTVERLRRLLRAPITERSCVAYSYGVEERQKKTRTVKDDKGNEKEETYYEWVTLLSSSDRAPFLLVDDTGRVPVAPEGASLGMHTRFSEEIWPGDPLYDWSYRQNSGQGRERRFTERTLEPGDFVYLIGTATFDIESGLPYVHRGELEPLFIITPETEKSLRRKYGCGGTGLAFLALLALGGTVFLGLGGPRAGDEVRIGIIAGAAALVAGLAVMFWYLMNDIVWVHNLVRKAWANIEADLKKRANLVPRLAAVVAAGAKHEKGTLEGIAEARAPGSARDAGEAFDEQERSLATVFAVVEEYPDLKANDLFLDLMKRLTRIENRLSHLREFYNDAVTSYANRIGQFPASVVARLTGHGEEPGIEARDVEVRPVAIDFDLPEAVR